MTLHGELVDSVKWILCDFYKAEPPLGDSNVEYDFAEKIVAAVREQIAKEIELLRRWDVDALNTGSWGDTGRFLGRGEVLAIIRGNTLDAIEKKSV